MRAATRAHAAFDLKGMVSSMTVLRLRTKDLNLVERQLRAKLAQLPQFFEDAPLVIDLGGLDGVSDLPLLTLVHALRALQVAPVGVINLAEEDRQAARAAGLAVLSAGAKAKPPPSLPADGVSASEPLPAEPKPELPAAQPAPQRTAPAAPLPHRPPVVVRQPVRSGQVVYAQATDLIVLAPVNSGAQLFADGNIHIYSSLRGRAMAGAQGYAQARIFCQKLEAELVALAGTYVLADEIPKAHRGKAAQVFLENGDCRFAAL